MRMDRSIPCHVLALTIPTVLAFVAFQPPAHAQQTGRVTIQASASSPVSGGSGSLSRERVERMAQAMQFDDVQSGVAMDLYRDLADARQVAAEAMRRDLEKARETMDDGDFNSMLAKIQGVTGRHQEQVEALESAFLEDLQALLSEEQADLWPKAQRVYRRGKHLGQALRSAARVDLDDLVRTDFADAYQRADVADVLDRWAVQVDGYLVERARKSDAIGGTDFRGGIFIMDGEDPFKELREIDARIASAGEQTVRTLMGVLGDDLVHDAWVRKAFARVYRPLDAERRLDAALALEGLRSEQREQLEAAATQHGRDAKAARDRWVEAEKEREANDRLPAGVVMVIEGQESSPSDLARKAVRELGDRLEGRLAAILTAEQLSALPEAEPEAEPMPGAVGGRSIRIGG